MRIFLFAQILADHGAYYDAFVSRRGNYSIIPHSDLRLGLSTRSNGA